VRELDGGLLAAESNSVLIFEVFRLDPSRKIRR
jgi:hypothetical protein